MSKFKLSLVILFCGLYISCSSTKKVELDDEFATEPTEATASAPADTAQAQEPSEFDLNQDINADSQSAPQSSQKDEFSDFEDSSTANQSTDVAKVEAVETKSAENANPEVAKTDDTALMQELNQTTPPVETPAPEVITPTPEAATVIPELQEKPAVVEAKIEPAPLAKINSVTYQSNQNGGAVSIATDQPPQFTTRMNAETNQLVVELQNSVIPKKLKRSLNTKDMASSIGSVDIYQKENSNVVRFVVQLRPNSPEPLVQPEGNSVIIVGTGNEEYLAKKKAEKEKAEKEKEQEQAVAATPSKDAFTETSTENSKGLEDFLIGNQKFYGKKISIETNSLDIKDAIKFIAEESGVNLLMDEGITGNISLKLKQIPWDQALILILKSKKLGYVRQGNVLRIAKLADLQTEELEAYKLLENRRSNEPLVVKRFFISYAKLSDLETKIREFMEATATVNPVAEAKSSTTTPNAAVNPNAPKATEVSKTRGRVISDERTLSLIVTDTPANLDKIEKLIAALDTQPKQIIVESRIVSASESFTKSIGVHWFSSGSTVTPNSARLGIDNHQSGVFDSTFAWGNLDVVGSLSARLTLGELQNKVRVLNTQRTTVLSGQIAKIEAKGKLNIPVTQVAVGTGGATPIGTSSFTTVEYGLIGEITPQASNENTVSADIKLSQTKIDNATTGSTTTNAIGGKVISKNGQTIVVQANFESTNTSDESGVPGLKDIPVLGSLFKGKTDIIKKAETMLFTTMYILDPIQGVTKKASSENSLSEVK